MVNFVVPEFELVQMPADGQRLVALLCGNDWPFHTQMQLTAMDVAAMAFANDDVVSFWVVDEGQRVGLVRAFDLTDIGIGAPLLDLRIATPQRGRGLGKLATSWIVNYLFSTYALLHRIEANTRADNIAMQRVLVDAGFIHEGTLRDAWLVEGGGWLDTMVYGLLRSDRFSG